MEEPIENRGSVITTSCGPRRRQCSRIGLPFQIDNFAAHVRLSIPGTPTSPETEFEICQPA